MTTSDPKKMLQQLNSKPGKKLKYEKHNLSGGKKHGRATKKCRRCGRVGAHVGNYGLKLCRQCFRETANNIGFKKFS